MVLETSLSRFPRPPGKQVKNHSAALSQPLVGDAAKPPHSVAPVLHNRLPDRQAHPDILCAAARSVRPACSPSAAVGSESRTTKLPSLCRCNRPLSRGVRGTASLGCDRGRENYLLSGGEMLLTLRTLSHRPKPPPARCMSARHRGGYPASRTGAGGRAGEQHQGGGRGQEKRCRHLDYITQSLRQQGVQVRSSAARASARPQAAAEGRGGEGFERLGHLCHRREGPRGPG